MRFAGQRIYGLKTRSGAIEVQHLQLPLINQREVLGASRALHDSLGSSLCTGHVLPVHDVDEAAVGGMPDAPADKTGQLGDARLRSLEAV